MSTAATAASNYFQRGWRPVPIPYKQKGPKVNGWQRLHVTEANLSQYFNCQLMNIGVLVGPPSKLIDIDLDSPEAVRLAGQLLPPTGSIFGRAGNRNSHRLYTTDEFDGAESVRHKDNEGKSIVELRCSSGLQTVFPDSVHPSGERIEWELDEEPQSVNLPQLAGAVRELAVACLLLRHYPSEGSRHELALSLAGWLLRLGWLVAKIEYFIEVVAEAAGDDEIQDRIRAVVDTKSKIDGGELATGYPNFSKLIGVDIAKTISNLLKSGDTAPTLKFNIEQTPGLTKSKVTAVLDDEVIEVDTFNVETSAKRTAFAKIVHGLAPHFEPAYIEGELLKAATTRPDTTAVDKSLSRAELLAERDLETEQALAAMPADIVGEAELMLQDEQLIETIYKDIGALGVVGERNTALAVYVAGTSRLLDKPLSTVTQGTTSSGKSHTNNRVAELFPPECRMNVTSMSAQALYYLEPGSLIHTFVVHGEKCRIQDDSQVEMTRALRELQSENVLDKIVTTTQGGIPVTKRIHQDGPIAYCDTTTLTDLFDEDSNRVLQLSTDEGQEQTAKVKQQIAEAAQYGTVDTSRTILIHHALQRLLKRVQVTIPFAIKLNAAIPSDKTQARRATSHIFEVIKAVSLLHQRQRFAGEIQHGFTIEATLRDYGIARDLLIGPLGRSLGGAMQPALVNLFRRLQDRYAISEVFTTSEAALSDPNVKSKKMAANLRTIADTGGAIELVEANKGCKPSKWRIVGELPEQAEIFLPEAVELGDIS
ncbi:MAG: bifunctional DNA primase/polymerase [Planctomycetes bacterium]|nr:bifunctional DNA primase/polymerase [Planctomycetota bacterium]